MKNAKLISIVLIFSMLLLFSASSFVLATDDDSDGVDDDYEELNKRGVTITVENDRIEIESILRAGATKDEVEIEVRNESDHVEIKLSYSTQFNASEVELEFSVKFRDIIEFVDDDLNGIYNDSEDTTVQTVALGDFQTISYTTTNLSSNTLLHYLKIGNTDGNFTFHLYVPEEFTIINDTVILPTQVKIDIEIKDFTYQDPSSQLALYTKLESSTEYEDENETSDEQEGYSLDEEGVITVMNNTQGFFHWKKTALIDGVEQNVTRSIKEPDSDGEKIYLNYPRGAHIYHDPEIGVANVLQQAPGGIPFINLYLLVALISLISAISWLAKKPKFS